MSGARLFPLRAGGPEFQRQAEALLPVRTPTAAWVDNTAENFRFWRLASLYAQDGVLTRAAALAVGEYQVVLPRGASLTEADGGYRLTGGFVFMTDSFSYAGGKLQILPNGLLTFAIHIPSTDALGIGLECAGRAPEPDPEFGERALTPLRSPLLRLSAPLELRVEFLPFCPERTRFCLAREEALETLYTTVYGEAVRLRFPEGFPFVFQRRATRAGRCRRYLAPAGTACGEGEALLMPGLSGTEYLRLPRKYTATFFPGGAGAGEDLPLSEPPTMPTLCLSGGSYHCQPQQARYYRAEGDLRPYQELPGLPAKEVSAPAVPLKGVWGGAQTAVRLEREFLYPARRAAFAQAAAKLQTLGGESLEAATRHGLRVRIEAGQAAWLRLGITDEPLPQLAFTNLTPAFLAALLADEMFLPLNDAPRLAALAATPYSITAAHLAAAEENGYRQAGLLKELCGSVYRSREDLERAVRDAGAEPSESLLDACDHFHVNAGGWRFLCSPAAWEESGGALALKFTTEGSLSQMARDPKCWSMAPQEDRIRAFQQKVAELEETLDREENAELRELLYDPHWCGSVAFSCPVESGGLPEELRFLAPGLDGKRFCARFVAFPAEADRESPGQISAMIDYRDEEHLRPEDYRDYAFKVTRLRVCIRNGQVRDFGARVELLINEWFGGAAFAYDKAGGNSVVLSGSYQRDSGAGHYVFSLEAPVDYSVGNSLIGGVRIQSAALTADGRNGRFGFSGELALRSLGKSDLLSYDRLPFRGLALEMTSTEKGYAFALDTRQLLLEPWGGQTRPDSFAHRFPAAPVRLLQGGGRSPQESGYAGLWVQDLEQGEVGGDWTGLLWEIRPGNLGDLSGIDSALELLVAWKPDSAREERGVPVFAGIRLGAAGSPDDWGLPLQGVMTLGFDAIELRRRTAREGEATRAVYFFQFRNFALRILGFRFPESNNDLYLIADEERRLGWYGEARG